MLAQSTPHKYDNDLPQLVLLPFAEPATSQVTFAYRGVD
jgi:hypothetical protein